MPTSSTITIKKVLSLGGGLRCAIGTWSQTAGAADLTLTLRGGVCYSAAFVCADGTGPRGSNTVPWTSSVSAGILTITLKAREAVTLGYFKVDFA